MKVKITLIQTKLHHYENVSVNHLKFKLICNRSILVPLKFPFTFILAGTAVSL